MKILVVAPDVKLPKAQEEAQHVINTHPGSYLLNGKVTTGRLLDSIRDRSFDVLWFMCHANEDGLDLGGAHRYGADVLAQMVRRSRAKLLFLNACSTQKVAERIYSMAQVPIVCTRADTLDEDSLMAGRWFADDLADGIDFREAFSRSRLDDFMLIPAQAEGARMDEDQYWQLRTRVRALEIRQAQVDLKLHEYDREWYRVERVPLYMLFVGATLLVMAIAIVWIAIQIQQIGGAVGV